MIDVWRALYNDGTFYDGPKYDDIDRSKLVAFEVQWGLAPRELAMIRVDVHDGLRLVWRRRRGASETHDMILEYVLVGLETKDRTYAHVWILHCTNGRPERWEQDGWQGPNLWPPQLLECEL